MRLMAHSASSGDTADRMASGRSAYKEQIERCKKCPCKICCRAERIYRTNYDLYKEMTARGDFKDGYMPRPKNH